MNIQHSSRTDEWGTPIGVLALAHEVLGQIDFDPASDPFFNARVGASYFYTREIDGLNTDWPDAGTIWCNPPGGKTGNASQTVAFWIKLMAYRSRPCFNHAIFMAFSAEARQTTQGKGVPSINEFPNCTPAKRIAFDRPDGTKGGAPSHSNCIVYVPGKLDLTSKFIETFSKLGATR
jgi:hypothetical protein